MTVKLSQLRVSADMEAEGFVRGAQQVAQASAAISAAAKLTGKELAAIDAGAEKASTATKALQRSFVDGYAASARFETAIKSLNSEMEKNNISQSAAAKVLQGMAGRYGEIGGSVDLYARGLKTVSPLVEALNKQSEARASLADREAKAIRDLATAQQAQGQIAKSAGILDGQGKSASESASVFSAEFARQRAEIEAMRSAQNASYAQGDINSIFGIGMSGSGSARDSASVFQAELDRLENIARMKAEEAGSAFSSTFNAMISGKLSGKSARDSASVFSSSLDEFDRIARMKAEEAGAVFNTALNARLGVGVQGKSARDSASVFQEQADQEAQVLRLREKIVSTYLLQDAAEERHKKNLAEILQLEQARRDDFSPAQANAAREAERVRFEQDKRSIEGTAIYKNKYGASGSGLARHEAVNLSRQIQDVFVSLQGGQAPLTVLIQQGTQIADIFATSQASMGGFARSVVVSALSVKGLIAALLLAGVSAGIAGYQFSEAQHEIQRNLNGIGRASGLTVDSINAIAEASKNLSRGEARDALGAFAATGRIGNNASGILDLVNGYGRQTGQDKAAAGKDLASIFADPLAGAEKLATTIGGIDAKTIEYIRTLKSKNDVDGAQKALIDAISGRMKESEQNIGLLESAWNSARKAASEYWDSLGKAVAGPSTTKERLAALEQEYQNSVKRRMVFGLGMPEPSNELSTMRDRLAIEERWNAAQVEKERTARRSREALSITDQFFPGDKERRDLEESLSKLSDFLKDPNADRLAESFKKGESAAKQMQENLAALLNPVQRIQLATEIAVKGIMARTVHERIIVERMQEQLALSQAGAKADEVRAQTAQRIAEIMANANRDARDALRDSNQKAQVLGLSPFAAKQKEAEFEYQRNIERFGTGGAAPPAGGAGLGGRFNGLDQTFATSLDQFIKAAAAEGYKLSVTSGYRSVEEQAKLYAEKPHLAAPPGRSNHNFGLAADLGFGLGAKDWAHANAERFGMTFPLKDRAKNPEAWHIEPFDARSKRSGVAGNDNAAAAEKIRANSMAEAYGPYLEMLRQAGVGIDAEKDALARLKAQSTATSFEMTKQAKVDEMMNTLRQQGIPITDEMKKKIDELASSYGNLGASMASAKLMQDAMFERSQFGRTSDEQAIASKLRGTGVPMTGPEAEAMRFNQSLLEAKGTAMDIGKTLIDGIRQGKNGAEILKNVFDKLLDRLANKALDSFVSGLFSGGSSGGGLFGGLFRGIFGGGGGAGAPLALTPSMNGNAFGANGLVHAFAGGGAFSNGIVTRPTLFNMGMMGEAGEEAIMPLKRDGNGRLGVMAATNSNAPQQQPVMHSVFAPVINAPGADAAALGALKREVSALGRKVEKRDMRDMRQRQGRGNY